MYLKSLSITQFKNFPSARFQFSPHLNFLTGENGAGKTNTLDAIHYLCLGKSYFHPGDQQSVKHDGSFFRLEGVFQNVEEQHALTCVFAVGGKKELSRNDIPYTRLTDHVGLIPVVMITPDDSTIIDEGSDLRRRFIDNTLSQIDHNYLEDLVNYNRILQQRNAALKQFAVRKFFDAPLIETLDDQLTGYGIKINEKRKKYLDLMIPVVGRLYELISGNQESVGATYNSALNREDFHKLLKNTIDKDRMLERTTEGVHRDDIDFLLSGLPAKKYGSQGQKKSFLMALKLSQYDLIKTETSKTPLLLLDDLFDKLDENRSHRILELIAGDTFSQVFITDTNTSRIREFISQSGKEHHSYRIHNGLAVTEKL